MRGATLSRKSALTQKTHFNPRSLRGSDVSGMSKITIELIPIRTARDLEPISLDIPGFSGSLALGYPMW